MQPEVAGHAPLLRNLPSEGWRKAIGLMLGGALLVMAITAREWAEMFHQWWNIDTYTHVLLVPFIIAWLVVIKKGEFAKMEPAPWLPGTVIVAAGVALLLVGRATGINFIAHAGAVGAVQGVAIATLGLRASLMLALPITFASFLVPFGDEIIPPLQAITAEIAILFTHLSGVPAEIDGIYIDTPVGLFIVAEACSGVKFLVAMITLAVLVCFTRFESWARRAMFMGVAIIVPVIANGVRAWGTIYIAQSQGVEFAAGFDHIFYGWIFFAIVVAIVLAGAWRFFEREPEDYGWQVDEIAAMPLVERLQPRSSSPVVVAATIAALALGGALLSAIVAPVALV